MGHFVADLTFMTYNGFLDTGNLIHHLMGISTYVCTGYLQHNFNALSLNILPAEISNIQMNLREVFKRMGWRYTKTYYINEWQYFIFYVICRSIWIPLCYYPIYNCSTTNPVVMIIYPLHIVMNFYYVSNVIALAKSRMREVKKLEKA